MRRILVLVLSLLVPLPLVAQKNTLDGAEAAARPKATLADAAWLVGDWRGTGLGAEVQDIWSVPMGGAMLGASRVVRDGKVIFYEILTIAEENGSLLLRLKHFNPDLKGWEEKDETRDFPLVRVTPDALWFDGMTFRRLGDDEIQVWVAIGAKDGTVREEEFRYRRY